MVLKKVDNRMRVLIENGVQAKHRSMFFVVGEKAKDQVVILHHMLSKAEVKARPSVLWCYKKELGFSSHRKKRMKKLQKKAKSGSLDVKKDDPFELFVSATNIRYCYYADTHKILGNTYGMLVLQDFEAVTPNLLARTIETVEGGGIVCLLLQGVESLKQLYTMTMDVHSRYRTEAHQEVVGRFNERFILSLTSCDNCMVIDDNFRVLPFSTKSQNITALPPKTKEESMTAEAVELKELQNSLEDTQTVGSLLQQCKTLDQGKALLKFIEVISEKTLNTTVTLTAARGRGKSATIGFALASAVSFGYSNIFVTSPSPENLKTLFEFVFKGFDALGYQEHADYEIIQSTNADFNKAVVRVNIFKEHRQTIQYISPTDHQKLDHAELLAIDEAAAIPLPLVKNLLGPFLVFMSSTINGYEGTGRSLSLKLIEQLRVQSGGSKNSLLAQHATASKGASRSLQELSLNESIRYANGDPVEQWLNQLLCLDASLVQRLNTGCPVPQQCELYYINRDTLFSYHRASEVFLQRIVSLFVASHYKNTPNDLQLMSDAPAHQLFCLLGPVDPDQANLPEVLCVVQVCLEGEISRDTVMHSLSRGKRASGDMIPWTVSQQFNDNEFAQLSGARVVRIATHPDFQRMGYGKRALHQLIAYYSGSMPSLDEQPAFEKIPSQPEDLVEEVCKPRNNLPPLLLKLNERKPEKLDYLGVSYGLTTDLLRFWKKASFTPVYLRQTANQLTGEHSCIMLRLLDETKQDSWLDLYTQDFQRRFISLLSFQFREFAASLGLSLLQQSTAQKTVVLTKETMLTTFTKYDLKRLDLYAKNLVDYHLIMDLVPHVATFFFTNRMDFQLSVVQKVILLAVGLQRKTLDSLEKELDLPTSQVMGLFNKIMKKANQYMSGILEADIEKSLLPERGVVAMEPTTQSLKDELTEMEKDFHLKKNENKKLKNIDLSEYEITGSTEEWNEALGKTKNLSNLSIPSTKEKLSKRKSKPIEDEKPKDKKHKKSKKKT